MIRMFLGRSRTVPVNRCLRCNNKQEAGTGYNTTAYPRPIDIAICLKCAYIMGFDKNMAYRELTPKEKVRVLSERSTQDLIHAIRMVKRPRHKAKGG